MRSLGLCSPVWKELCISVAVRDRIWHTRGLRKPYHVETAAMDPDKHWQADVFIAGWSYDIEVQAVFGLLVSNLITSVADALLSTCISIV